MARLIVCIVNWNTRELTRNCLRSIYESIGGMECEVWIVDNASSDGSVEMIRNEFPLARLIENTENVGFARANNQVLKTATGDYYLLLNSDTIVPANSIRTLVEFMETTPQCAAVGPSLIYADGTLQPPLKALPSVSGEFKYCLAYHFFPFGKIFKAIFKDRSSTSPKDGGAVRKEILSAACLLIRRSVIERIGFLGEEYFLFSEENDYFTRMRQAGFESYYLPFVDVIHLVGKSRENRNTIDSEANFLKSRLLYFSKFYPRRIGILRLIYSFFLNWSFCAASFSKYVRRAKESEFQSLYARLLEVLHGSETKNA